MRAGRFEEKGHMMCRALVVTLTNDDDEQPILRGIWYPMLIVAIAWGLALPIIYGGRVLDALLACDVDAATCSVNVPVFDGHVPRIAHGYEHDQNVPPVVIDI